jgi:hypothetical protein
VSQNLMRRSAGSARSFEFGFGFTYVDDIDKSTLRSHYRISCLKKIIDFMLNLATMTLLKCRSRSR